MIASLRISEAPELAPSQAEQIFHDVILFMIKQAERRHRKVVLGHERAQIGAISAGTVGNFIERRGHIRRFLRRRAHMAQAAPLINHGPAALCRRITGLRIGGKTQQQDQEWQRSD